MRTFMDKAYDELLQYSFRLLGRKQYAKKELEKKLTARVKRRNMDEGGEAVQKVLVRLRELGYVNDAKLLTDYLTYSVKEKLEGKHAFLLKMRRKGIDSSQARTAWICASIDEAQLANELLEKMKAKFASLDRMARKRRIAGLLARRGFSSELIWSLIAKL